MRADNRRTRGPLRLRRETLRAMSDTELDAVAGGKTAGNTRPKTNIWTGDYVDGGDNLCSY
jgi:hypothetical protein